MASLKEISNGQIRQCFGNSCLIKGVLAINGAGAATVKTTSALSYTVDGVYYNKNALAAQSLAPTHDAFGGAIGGQNLPSFVQPAGSTVYYLLSLDAAGNVYVSQGTYAGQSLIYPDKQRQFAGTGNVPAEPKATAAGVLLNTCPIGMVKVATGPATTFTPGTTALDAAGLTVTYFDLEYVPSTLQP